MNNLDEAFINGSQAVKVVTTNVGADTPLVSKSRGRIALYIYPAGAAITCVFPGTMAAAGQGIGISSSKPLEISQRTHGDLATEEWHAFQAGAQVLVVVEVFSCPCATGH